MNMIEYELLRGRKVLVTGISRNALVMPPLYRRQTEEIKDVVNRFPMTLVMYGKFDEVLFFDAATDTIDGVHPRVPYSKRLYQNAIIFSNRLLGRDS